MGVVIQFQPKTVSLLWSPRKGTNPAWRLNSTSSVIELKPKVLETPKTFADVNNLNGDLIRDIEFEVAAIVDRLDEQWIESIDDYDYLIADEDPDTIIAEFCSNYVPDYIDDESIDTGSELIAEFLKLGLTKEQVVDLIIQSCDLDAAGIYKRTNELYSCIIGEFEYEIYVNDYEHLESLISQATDEELKAANVKRDSFLAYGNPCDRVVWIVDPNRLMDSLNQLKNKGA